MQHNAKVNEPDGKLRTPLLLAYQHGHVRVAHYLWDRGADPTMSYGLSTALFVNALKARLTITCKASDPRSSLLPNNGLLAVCRYFATLDIFDRYLENFRVRGVC